MAFSHEYAYPVIPVTGSVVTSGLFGDLKDLAGSHSVAIFDAQTYGVATGSGNGKKFFIGWSSEHTRDTMTKFWVGMQNPSKTWDFKGSEVLSFEVSQPQRLQNEKWVIGFDGTAESNGLTYQKGKSTGVRIGVTGEPAYRVFQRTLEHEVFVTVPEDCSGNCAEGCDDGVDCEKYTNELAKAINTHPELSILGVRARVITSDYAAPTPNMQKWELSVCDEGDSNALAAVQVIVNESMDSKPVVSRIARVGSVSTYEICAPDGETPADFVPTENVSIATCDTCPAGYDLVAAMQTLYVVRPITPTTDLDDDAAKDTWADGVGSTYGVADANATFVSNNGNGTATAKLKIAATAAIPAAVNSDIVIVGAVEGAYCDPTAAVTPIEWVETTTAYRGTRTLRMTLERPVCDASGDWLADMEAFYANDPEVVVDSIVKLPGSVGCADTYEIEQWSKGCSEDSCLAAEVLEFNELQGFNNQLWEVVPEAQEPASGKKCGLEIEAGYIDTTFGNCSFDPNDYYNYEPIRLTVSFISEFATGCDLATMPKARKIQYPISQRQSGEWLLREYIKYKQAYGQGAYSEWTKNPRLREALDVNFLAQVDRSAFYKVYYLTFKADRGDHQFDQLAEVVEAQFAFKEGEQAKAAAFENAILAPLGKFGVTLQNR